MESDLVQHQVMLTEGMEDGMLEMKSVSFDGDDKDVERLEQFDRTINKSSLEKYKSIARPLRFPAAAIFLNFAVTLFLFPGIVVEMKSPTEVAQSQSQSCFPPLFPSPDAAFHCCVDR